MAMNGIRYRGVHSREFGLVTQTRTRPAAPNARLIQETVPYRDGSLDYSEQGGRLYYDEKLVEIEFTAIRRNLTETNSLISQVVKWLCGGWGDLIFDDMPLVVWRAKPVDVSSISIMLYRAGRFTVQFRCRPFNTLIYDTLGAVLDSDVPLDSDIPLDWGADNIYSLPTVGEYTFSHYNPGDVNAAPQIVIIGDTDSSTHMIEVLINGEGFTLKLPSGISLSGGQSVTVDCEECMVTKGGLDITEYLVSSDTNIPTFPEFLPGDNVICVNTQITGEMQIKYNVPYFFGANNTGGIDNG